MEVWSVPISSKWGTQRWWGRLFHKRTLQRFPVQLSVSCWKWNIVVKHFIIKISMRKYSLTYRYEEVVQFHLWRHTIHLYNWKIRVIVNSVTDVIKAYNKFFLTSTKPVSLCINVFTCNSMIITFFPVSTCQLKKNLFFLSWTTFSWFTRYCKMFTLAKKSSMGPIYGW